MGIEILLAMVSVALMKGPYGEVDRLRDVGYKIELMT